MIGLLSSFGVSLLAQCGLRYWIGTSDSDETMKLRETCVWPRCLLIPCITMPVWALWVMDGAATESFGLGLMVVYALTGDSWWFFGYAIESWATSRQPALLVCGAWLALTLMVAVVRREFRDATWDNRVSVWCEVAPDPREYTHDSQKDGTLNFMCAPNDVVAQLDSLVVRVGPNITQRPLQYPAVIAMRWDYGHRATDFLVTLGLWSLHRVLLRDPTIFAGKHTLHLRFDIFILPQTLHVLLCLIANSPHSLTFPLHIIPDPLPPSIDVKRTDDLIIYSGKLEK